MTRPARRRRPREAGPSQDRWLVSYADFITLLFAFFTTLYAISTVDARKLTQVVDSMQAAFAKGDVPAEPRRIGAGTSPGPARGPHERYPLTSGSDGPVPVTELKARLVVKLGARVEVGFVDVEVDPRGLVVSMREAGNFATGSADLSLTARAILADLAAALRDVGNALRIEGHTDDVPIHTARYASNWELSTARATAVVEFLMEQGLTPDRLSAAGYAEFHPRLPNDSDDARAENRRVDIVILNPLTTQREEPGH